MVRASKERVFVTWTSFYFDLFRRNASKERDVFLRYSGISILQSADMPSGVALSGFPDILRIMFLYSKCQYECAKFEFDFKLTSGQNMPACDYGSEHGSADRCGVNVP